MKKLKYSIFILISLFVLSGCSSSDNDDQPNPDTNYTQFINATQPLLVFGSEQVDLSVLTAKKVSTLQYDNSRGTSVFSLFFGVENSFFVVVKTPVISNSAIDSFFSVGEKKNMSIETKTKKYNISFKESSKIKIHKVEPKVSVGTVRCKRLWLSFIDSNSNNSVYLVTDVYYE